MEASGRSQEASEFFTNCMGKFIRNNQLSEDFLNFWAIFNFTSQFNHELYKDSYIPINLFEIKKFFASFSYKSSKIWILDLNLCQDNSRILIRKSQSSDVQILKKSIILFSQSTMFYVQYFLGFGISPSLAGAISSARLIMSAFLHFRPNFTLIYIKNRAEGGEGKF